MAAYTTPITTANRVFSDGLVAHFTESNDAYYMKNIILSASEIRVVTESLLDCAGATDSQF